MSEQQRTKSNLEYSDQEKSLSSESESSWNEIVNNRKQKISLDCPDYAKTNTNRGSQKRYFIVSIAIAYTYVYVFKNPKKKNVQHWSLEINHAIQCTEL